MKTLLMLIGLGIIFAFSDWVLAEFDPTLLAFKQHYLDVKYGEDKKPGWVQAGDLDGDGDLDIAAGGGRAMFVYENQGKGLEWERYGDLDSTGNMGANGAVLYDVDMDGDLDVVSGTYKQKLGWWENPGGPGGELGSEKWVFHVIDEEFKGSFAHDIYAYDLDGDGQAREIVVAYNPGYWDSPVSICWYRAKGDGGSGDGVEWERYLVVENLPGPQNQHAGLDVGDIDGDGKVDLAFAGGWLRQPGDLMREMWEWRLISDLYGISNTQVRDMDGDGDLDVVMSAGHHGVGVFWYANPGEDVVLGEGKWKQYVIDGEVVHPEGLAVEDVNGDGLLDVIACELDFSNWDKEVHNLYGYKNMGGRPAVWRKINLAPNSYASHKLFMVDINEDGKLDLISEGCGYSVINYYENVTGQRNP